MNLAQHLMRSGNILSDLPALYVGSQVYASFGQLARTAAQLAGAMTGKLGLVRGDRVAILMKNVPQYVEVLYAAWHAGLVAVPINARLHPRELAYILDNSGAKVCFATDDLMEVVSPVLANIPALEQLICVGDKDYKRFCLADAIPMRDCVPAAGAWLSYTSGTTGTPKGAELSHRNLLLMGAGYQIDVERVSPIDRLLHLGPMSHGSGVYILTRVASGAAQIIPESSGFDPAEVFSVIAHHPRVSFFAAPTMVKRLVSSPEAQNADTQNLGTIVYGGAPMYLEDLKRALALFGPKLAQVYGQSESPMAITVLSKSVHADSAHPEFEERIASVGVAQSVVEVRIADQDGRAVPAGEMGEVIVRGDTVMSGYWQNVEATKSAIRDGWLFTGDVAVMNEKGFVTLKDRSKDVIISGGLNIYPREVEEVLLRHPLVSEVSVIGRKDPKWGESVVAFVACLAGQQVNEAELDQLCLDNIARYKRPKEYRFIDHLPKSGVGKILKTELRSQLSRDPV
jgi:long-chain acyl-CoA synthetase